MTFWQELMSSWNCCFAVRPARGYHREQQIVVDVGQLVPLVSVHDTFTLQSDLDCLANPACSLVWLTGDDRGLVSVDNVIFLVDVIRDCRSVLFWLWLFPGTSGIFTTFLCLSFLLMFYGLQSCVLSLQCRHLIMFSILQKPCAYYCVIKIKKVAQKTF